MSIADNLKIVMERITAAAERSGRDPASVRLVAATKTVPPERIMEAVQAGVAVIGENRVQEAREKINLLGNVASWHLIGTLQKNKAKYAVRLFDLIHSVDSLDLARELDRQAWKLGKVQDVLIEVNIARGAGRFGVLVDEAAQLVHEAAGLKNIYIRGLMTMPPYSEDPEDSRSYFRKLRELSAEIAGHGFPRISMTELSMGMSGDFEVAIEEGATLVRVGTAIFGERV